MADRNRDPPVVPARFRFRLAFAFVAVAAFAAGSLAILCFLLELQSRQARFAERSRDEFRFTLATVPDRASVVGWPVFVSRYGARAGVDAVVEAAGQVFSSNPALSLADVPGEVRAAARQGELRHASATAADTADLVVGGRLPDAGAQLYLFFSKQTLWEDLRSLGIILAGGWAVVVTIAGAVGSRVARRTLSPVAQGARAARAVAEGMLETRLPVESEDEFGEWADAFNHMADALQRKIADLSAAQARERRFTSDVAHELRTPLGALVGVTSLLRDHLDEMPSEARRLAELLAADVARLRRLVEDLLEISRLGSGREVVALEAVDLRAAIDALVRLRGWESKTRLEGQEVQVSTDRRRLERIVANLVENAVRHGGGATVSTGRAGDRAFVAVADSGPGIPSEQLPHIFEPFYKADPARSGPGSGLGLAIAAQHVKLLGADIEVCSERRRGSQFTLWLPADAESTTAADGSAAR